jgi:hypothetical protein
MPGKSQRVEPLICSFIMKNCLRKHDSSVGYPCPKRLESAGRRQVSSCIGSVPRQSNVVLQVLSLSLDFNLLMLLIFYEMCHHLSY